MLSKLFKGELSLAATFWKFGVLGLIVLKLALRLFGNFLSAYTQNGSIMDFFTRNFHAIYSPKISIFWTLCYLSTLLITFFYSWHITLGVWRSANNYDKSVWLRFLAKAGIIIVVVYVWSAAGLPAMRFLGI